MKVRSRDRLKCIVQSADEAEIMENTRNIAGGLRVAPRSFPGGMGPRRARSASPASVCRPAGQTGEPAPIWMAVLQATECQAVANGEDHTVQWDYAAGRARYTN